MLPRARLNGERLVVAAMAHLSARTPEVARAPAGHQQIRRPFDGTTISEAFIRFEVNVLLFLATRMAIMAAALFALVVNDKALGAEVRDRLIAFSKDFDRLVIHGTDAAVASS